MPTGRTERPLNWAGRRLMSIAPCLQRSLLVVKVCTPDAFVVITCALQAFGLSPECGVLRRRGRCFQSRVVLPPA